ncbi:MAG: glycosyltransferase family 4 protein [Alphaproteobacteria bacterium]|nr:glycosyltransferase family 4 protein [Alphaproteobacteria bacterium]
MILFDLSRLVSRAGRGTPTGIDRVELAYAEHLIASKHPLCFTLMTPFGFGGVSRAQAHAYLEHLAWAWRHSDSLQQINRAKRLARKLQAAALCRGQRALLRQPRSETGVVYMLVSHHHLEKRRAIARLKRQARARFVCLIHDLIPIEFPEYALPGQNDKHRRRIESAAALADAVIVNSTVTRDGFMSYLARAGRTPPVVVARLGVDLAAAVPAVSPPVKPPYFVCVGTIEARKNHLLLLNLWRQLVVELGEAAPRLVLVGQRGWETENAIDMLERCPALRGVVFERSDVADIEAARLVQGAQALLLPSFAEGFGFPLVEALALGVPVLCSDLAALRENGGDVPEYLDPLDGLAWRRAITDYALPASPRRAAQLDRLSRWKPPTWQEHFAAVEALIAEVQSVGQYEAEHSTAAGPKGPRSWFDDRRTAAIR